MTFPSVPISTRVRAEPERTFRLPGLLLALSLTAPAMAGMPLADVHTHYKWSQAEVTSPADVLATLERNDIALAVVIGTPPERALELAARAPDRILPFWSPYRIGGDWSRWAFDPETVERARSALASGRWRGIGELHLLSGFAPRPDAPVLDGLAQLAAAHRVPIMLHTDFASESWLVALCRRHAQTRFIWAHAGGILPPAAVDRALAACPNLWVDLSARDPWRHVRHPVADAQGRLLPEWRALLERWPQRFMVGSDPVWPVDQLDAWDRDDTGWQEYARFIDFHRRWLAELPDGLARRIAIDNARALFGVGP